MSSYAAALSGLLANSTALNVVGDNLANMNTTGFKSNTVGFEDAMVQANASLQIGDGVGATTTTRNFTQGTVQSTGGQTDAAIQGNGFFVVQDPNSGTQYTRDGTFSLNSSGQLVTATGDLVQGWMATNGIVNSSGAAGNITVPLLSSQAPSATQNMSLNANLNAAAAVGDTFSAPVQIVDSLGETHTLTVTFTNTAAGAWSYNVDIDGGDLKGGTAGTPTSIATGNVTFDSSGNLTSPAPPGVVAVTNKTALADGAATLNINWNLFSGTTSTLTGYAQTSASSGTTQDGVQAATVSGISIQNGGQLIATFSDGSTQTIAQVALANISNPDSLIATQSNNYMVGGQTIPPSIGAPSTGGRGNIVGGALEGSNVDMATQFTNLIVFQSGYEANSKVITTVDQMDQTLLALQI